MLSKIALDDFQVEIGRPHWPNCECHFKLRSSVFFHDCEMLLACVVAGKSREVDTLVTQPLKILVRARCTWSIDRQNR